MEDYIQISKLNDFIFCPKSIYFHAIFESFSEKTYHDMPQTVGKIKHEIIENGEYSSLKRYLQGTDVRRRTKVFDNCYKLPKSSEKYHNAIFTYLNNNCPFKNSLASILEKLYTQ